MKMSNLIIVYSPSYGPKYLYVKIAGIGSQIKTDLVYSPLLSTTFENSELGMIHAQQAIKDFVDKTELLEHLFRIVVMETSVDFKQ